MTSNFTNWFADISSAVAPTLVPKSQQYQPKITKVQIVANRKSLIGEIASKAASSTDRKPPSVNDHRPAKVLRPTSTVGLKLIPLEDVNVRGSEDIDGQTNTHSEMDGNEYADVQVNMDANYSSTNCADVIVEDVSSDSLSPIDTIMFDPKSSFNPIPHARSTNFVTFAEDTFGDGYLDYFNRYQVPAREAEIQKRIKKAIAKNSMVKGSLIVLSDSDSDESVDSDATEEYDYSDEDTQTSKPTFMSAKTYNPEKELAIWHISKSPEKLKSFLTANMRKTITKREPLPERAMMTNILMSESQSILSIDIGVKNLGYSVITYKEPVYTIEDVDVVFGICNISDGKGASDTVIASRCTALLAFLSKLMYDHNITRVIIEKQVPTNVKAMELMYAIYGMSSILLGTTDPDKLVIYDPKLKFTTLNVPYNTKNKAHKRQSIAYASRLFDSVFKSGKDAFAKHQKKDDIADSLNQALIWMVDYGIFENMNIDDLKVRYGIVESKNTVNVSFGSCEVIATEGTQDEEDADNTTSTLTTKPTTNPVSKPTVKRTSRASKPLASMFNDAADDNWELIS